MVLASGSGSSNTQDQTPSRTRFAFAFCSIRFTPTSPECGESFRAELIGNPCLIPGCESFVPQRLGMQGNSSHHSDHTQYPSSSSAVLDVRSAKVQYRPSSSMEKYARSHRPARH